MKIKTFIVLVILFFIAGGNIVEGKVSSQKAKTSKTLNSSKKSLKSIFQNNIGKYPYEIKLLNQPALKNRLIKLLGSQRYARMLKYWNVETPIEFDYGNYHTVGFEAHNAGWNDYTISYNPTSDNLCVIYITDGKKQVFKEKQENAYWDY